MLLAPFINTPETTIEHAWNRFQFPASLPGDLPSVLGNVEIFVAALQNRPPRSRPALNSLIDASVLAEARR
jgi:NitT/TauT family transport system substrate-binding protein